MFPVTRPTQGADPAKKNFFAIFLKLCEKNFMKCIFLRTIRIETLRVIAMLITFKIQYFCGRSSDHRIHILHFGLRQKAKRPIEAVIRYVYTTTLAC